MFEGPSECGFAIELGPLGLRVVAWGFWDAPTSQRFAPAVLDALRPRWPSGVIVVDASRLKPQREHGQAAFLALALGTTKLDARVDLIVDNAITRMQLGRILRENGVRGWTIRSSTTTEREDP